MIFEYDMTIEAVHEDPAEPIEDRLARRIEELLARGRQGWELVQETAMVGTPTWIRMIWKRSIYGTQPEGDAEEE